MGAVLFPIVIGTLECLELWKEVKNENRNFTAIVGQI